MAAAKTVKVFKPGTKVCVSRSGDSMVAGRVGTVAEVSGTILRGQTHLVVFGRKFLGHDGNGSAEKRLPENNGWWVDPRELKRVVKKKAS